MCHIWSPCDWDVPYMEPCEWDMPTLGNGRRCIQVMYGAPANRIQYTHIMYGVSGQVLKGYLATRGGDSDRGYRMQRIHNMSSNWGHLWSLMRPLVAIFPVSPHRIKVIFPTPSSGSTPRSSSDISAFIEPTPGSSSGGTNTNSITDGHCG